MQDQLQRIEDKVTAVQLDVAKNTVSLTAHMARTEINERRLEKLEYVLIGLAAVSVLGGVIKLLIS